MHRLDKALGLVLLLACGSAVACHRQVDYEQLLPRDPEWPPVASAAEAAAPEMAGLNLAAAAQYSADRDGAALVVLRHGKLLYQSGQNGRDLLQARHLFSGTKSFSCALAVVLQSDGLLDLDKPAAAVLTEWQPDSRKSRITPRQLLNFTSGLDDNPSDLTRDGLRRSPKVQDKYSLATALPAIHEPGTHYAYGSQHLMAFGAWVVRKTGRDPLDLLQERVFGPLGMKVAGWHKDPAGHAALPYGAWTTALEWAKFGELVRLQGQWQGKQVLDAGRLEACMQGSGPMPLYGLAWWLNRPLPSELRQAAELPPRVVGKDGSLFGASAPADLVMAAGFDDQRLYLSRSLGLVVARLSAGSPRWSDAEFLAALLGPGMTIPK